MKVEQEKIGFILLTVVKIVTIHTCIIIIIYYKLYLYNLTKLQLYNL